MKQKHNSNSILQVKRLESVGIESVVLVSDNLLPSNREASGSADGVLFHDSRMTHMKTGIDNFFRFCKERSTLEFGSLVYSLLHLENTQHFKVDLYKKALEYLGKEGLQLPQPNKAARPSSDMASAVHQLPDPVIVTAMQLLTPPDTSKAKKGSTGSETGSSSASDSSNPAKRRKVTQARSQARSDASAAIRDCWIAAGFTLRGDKSKTTSKVPTLSLMRATLYEHKKYWAIPSNLDAQDIFWMRDKTTEQSEFVAKLFTSGKVHLKSLNLRTTKSPFPIFRYEEEAVTPLPRVWPSARAVRLT